MSKMVNQSKEIMSRVRKPPAGWDQETYNNFKKANPTLEPWPEDTRLTEAAGKGPFGGRVDPALLKPKPKLIDNAEGLKFKANIVAGKGLRDNPAGAQLKQKMDKVMKQALKNKSRLAK